MKERYKQACAAYLNAYIKKENSEKGTLWGWYHFIDSPDFSTVGVVATAQILILIKDEQIKVPFDCKCMLRSLINMQNADGGWSYRSNILDSATEPTALAIQALLLWNEQITENVVMNIEKGISWLLRFANEICLWGPINKKEESGHVYFSCVVLRCLHRIQNYAQIGIEAELLVKTKAALDKGCESLLVAFDNNDNQCGWGCTVSKEPTIFHTAYLCVTLLESNPGYGNQHPIVKSLAFLLDYARSGRATKTQQELIKTGIHEIYQSEAKRLTYTHSADVYTLLAILCGYGSELPSSVREQCERYVTCAERTNWRYQGFVTFWRLYDIVRLCGKYNNLGKKMRHFKVALTFAGESRDLVENIAMNLEKAFGKDEILYDKFHEADFARPQLDIYLQELYHNCSDLIVVFLCSNYTHKKWCGVEWRAIRDLLNNFEFNKIMYIKADDNIDGIDVPGFYKSEDGYIDAMTHTPQEIAGLIIDRYNKNMVATNQ